MRTDVRWLQGFLLGAILGIASGGLMGVLYAPAKGARTRRHLARRAGKVGDRAADALGTAGDFVDRGRKRVGL